MASEAILKQKQVVIDEIKGRVEVAKTIVLFDYRGITDSEAKEFTVYIIGLGFTGELNSSGDVFTLDIDNEKVDLIRQAE